MTKRVLLLSGTSEGPPLARALLAAGFDVYATVTRPEAVQTLFGPPPARSASEGGVQPSPLPPPRSGQGEQQARSASFGTLSVEARGFTEASLREFLGGGGADLVLDATHPFAVRITRIAHAVCQALGTPYVRYERPDWGPPPGTRLAGSFAEAADLLPALGRRCLLTIGAKQLEHFAHLQGRLFLMARVLPCVVSLQQALAAGFTADRILCARPPFSQEFNRAILREYAVDVLLTKASGLEGGVKEKVLAARDLEIEVVMIRRPELPDVHCLHTPEAAVQACLFAGGEG